jgi:hypothetical protein
MAFRTTLFKLLNSNAAIVVDGYEIETVQDYSEDANGNVVMRCECDEENDWFFIDQEVVVSDEGECKAMTAPGDWDTGSEPFEATLKFLVTRSIVESDLSA